MVAEGFGQFFGLLGEWFLNVGFIELFLGEALGLFGLLSNIVLYDFEGFLFSGEVP